MSQELLHLQAENRRLMAVVATLAEKIIQLETQLSAREAGSRARPVTTNGGQGWQETGGPFSQSERDNEIPAVPCGAAGRDTQEPGNPFRTTERTAGNSTPFPLLQEGVPGNLPPLQPSLPDEYRRRIAELEQEGERQRRVSVLAAAALPDAKALARVLQESLTPRPLWSRALHLALLLRWLCRPEPPLASYPALQQALGLSYGGVNKIRRAALDYRLIRKTGQLRYTLAVAGIGALERALQVHPSIPSPGHFPTPSAEDFGAGPKGLHVH